MTDFDPEALAVPLRALIAASDAPGLSPADETLALRAAAAEAMVSTGLMARLWREIEGERRRRSSAPPVAVWGGRTQAQTLSIARARFGAAARLMPMETPQTTLASARPPQGVAVIALQPDNAWWLRLLAEPQLKVFASLPETQSPSPRCAFAVAAVETGPTGADETYFVTDAAVPFAQVQAALQEAGLIGETLQETGGLKLVALAGYVQADDARLSAVPGHLKGVIGHSPLPFSL
jgi:hypothetical protein